MDLINHTPYVAGLFRTTAGKDRILASLVVKQTYRITGSGLELDSAAPWPADGPPVKTEAGELDPETPFVREGADFILVGKAYTGRKPAPEARVEVRIGKQTLVALNVFGDRRWEKSALGLAPSPPEEFTSMPLGWDRAYGGAVALEGGKFPFGPNPTGRGFYLSEEQALGQPLPNIEDPDRPIAAWKDQPEPLGTGPYPKNWSLRAMNSIEYDVSNPAAPLIKEIKPAYFNNAHPRLILPAAPPEGETIEIEGVRPSGKLTFKMPATPVHAYVQLADRGYIFPGHADGILVLAEEERVVISQRVCFRYALKPLERRAVVLREGKAPGSAPPEYTIAWPPEGGAA